ncbi:hypothetical protein BH20ACI1_BH20ACI1_14960 [soil metagenome]
MKRRGLIKQLGKTGAQSVPVAMSAEREKMSANENVESNRMSFASFRRIATGTDCAPVNLAKSIIKKLSNE